MLTAAANGVGQPRRAWTIERSPDNRQAVYSTATLTGTGNATVHHALADALDAAAHRVGAVAMRKPIDRARIVDHLTAALGAT